MSWLLLAVHVYATFAALFCPFVALAWWQTWRRHRRAVVLLEECQAHFMRCRGEMVEGGEENQPESTVIHDPTAQEPESGGEENGGAA